MSPGLQTPGAEVINGYYCRIIFGLLDLNNVLMLPKAVPQVHPAIAVSSLE